MTVTQLDVLNAISTRFARGYATCMDNDVADELMTPEASEVTSQLELASRAGLVALSAGTPTERRAMRSPKTAGALSPTR
ncbi:MAG: hypothetical protein ACYC91_15490 [Solirubrobacteraceae bacterium]